MSMTQLDPGEKVAEANGITLCYQTFGDPEADPLLLIMGLGAQMIWWEDGLCEMLAGRGYRVVRFDNRDIGKSSTIDVPPPNLMRVFAGLEQLKAPYTLNDMAQDTVGLLDALDIDKAHIVGASMGGMIAQILAIEFPERVKTLTSIMSSTGEPNLPRPKPEVWAEMSAPPPLTAEAYVAANIRMSELLRGYVDADEAESARRRSVRAAARGLNPAGGMRQIAAIGVAGDRTKALAGVKAPTLVIHGVDDPLVSVKAGEATARAISGAKLLLLERMGHTVPRALWPTIVDAIADHAR